MTDTVLLIDGNHALHRVLHTQKGRLKLPDGTPTGGILGVLEVVQGHLADYSPKRCIVCFDRGPYHRAKLYPEYKADRNLEALDPKRRKEEEAHRKLFDHQKPVLLEVLPKMGVHTLTVPGYEADDLLWKVPRMNLWSDADYVVCSADKDLLQVVDSNTIYDRIFFTKGEAHHEVTTVKNFKELHGITLPQFLIQKALVGGDDNIKGVKGVGPVACKDLFAVIGDDLSLPTIKKVCEESHLSKLRAVAEPDNWARFKLNTLLVDLSRQDYPRSVLEHIRVTVTADLTFNPDEMYNELLVRFRFAQLLKRWTSWSRPFVRLNKSMKST